MILRFNNRIPTKEIVLHFLTIFSKEEIISLRTKIFRYLTEHKLIAVVNIELSRGRNSKPNNTVHFHLLTDDTRNENELRELLEVACENNGLIKNKNYWISYRKLYDGYGYFNYFTKCGFSKDVILFQKGIRLHKYYQIGKWFNKSKKLIWEDFKVYLNTKLGTGIEESKTPDYYEEFLDYAEESYSDNEIPIDMTQDAIDKFNEEYEKYKSEQDNIKETEIIIENDWEENLSNWFEYLGYHLPKKCIRDKRYEWDRYRYSIAFLN
jgi:hypothetical protein